MAIIDPDGLFHGDRLKRCSDLAQLYWTRFLLASNSFGRLKLNYGLLLKDPLASLKTPPPFSAIVAMFKEYHAEHLGYLYLHDGEWWCQWDVPQRLMARYQTAADRRSPKPPQELFDAWRDEYAKSKESSALDLMNFEVLHKTDLTTDNSRVCETTSNHIDSCRLGVGVGVGEGIGKKQNQNPAGKPADERFKTFVEALSNYWKFKNPTITLTFGPAEGKQLKNLLADNPGLTLEQFTTCLRHRARSDVVHSEPPRVWLSAAVKYANGPLDRFNKPMEEHGDVRTKSAPEQRMARIIANTTAGAAIRPLGRITDCLSDGNAGNDAGSGRYLEGETTGISVVGGSGRHS